MDPAGNDLPFHRILAIARNTFREAIRDRILYNLVLFVLLITVCAVLLGDLTDGHEARVIVSIGTNAVLLFGSFIAIFVGVGLVSKEIEKRTVYAFFSKPVRRGEFVVGKYLGLCLTLLVNTAVMGVGITAALAFVGGTGLLAPLWSAVALTYLELAIMTAIAILFSSFSSVALSALFSFLVFLIGHLTSSLRDLAATMDSSFASAILNGAYFILPNLSIFSFRTEAANGLLPGSSYFSIAVAYALAYIAVVLSISILIFARRNFK